MKWALVKNTFSHNFFRITRKIRWIYTHQVKILATLDRKYLMSLTPLNAALNAFNLALNDSAEAFVLLLSKKLSISISS